MKAAERLAMPRRRPLAAGMRWLRSMPPAARLPLLALGFAALATGSVAGLARVGWAPAHAAAGLAGLHGPLMVCGFFGLLIALERAVAIGREWAYLGPAIAGGGVLCLLAGSVGAGAWLFVASAVVLLAATIETMRRQPALFTFTLALGAGCLVVGNAMWALGTTVAGVLSLWLSFLVLTIAGERLELSRFLAPSPMARVVFVLLLALVVAAILAQHAGDGGGSSFGAALLGLAAWLMKQDIARRTVRGRGLTRYIAVCLLAGYAWLAVGGALLVAGAVAQPASPAHDAALHAITLGFVFSMVLGHAAIVLPAVTRLALPYRPSFYAPLALLHVSLAVRVAGDVAGDVGWMRTGALLNALALAAFVATTAGALVRGRRRSHRTSGGAPEIER
nr:hypothetical protein [Caldimonas sp.]